VSAVLSDTFAPVGNPLWCRFSFAFDLATALLSAGHDLSGLAMSYQLVLATIRETLDCCLEQHLGNFFVALCGQRPREYRAGVIEFAIESCRLAAGFWPRAALLQLVVWLTLRSDYSDEEKALLLIRSVRELPEFQRDVMMNKLFDELAKDGGTWRKVFVGEGLANTVLAKSFGSAGKGHQFFEKVVGEFTSEDAIELVRKIGTPVFPGQWTAIAWIFEKFKDRREELLDALPVKQRVATENRQISAAMDVIYDDRDGPLLGPFDQDQGFDEPLHPYLNPGVTLMNRAGRRLSGSEFDHDL
jgi:hypothetical protein